MSNIQYTPEIIQRFWSKVTITNNPDDCWEWKAAIRRDGYGLFCIHKPILISAHRFSYILSHGKIPDELFVLHSCDNKLCVNPNHLFAGTRKDNTEDMLSKGRQAKGERQGSHKLTSKQVEYIRQCIETGGIRQYKLAREMGISVAQISRIVNRKQWRS